MTDEGKPIGLLLSIEALIARCAARLGHEADLLIVADRLYFAASAAGQLANRKSGGSLGCAYHANYPLKL